MGVPRVSLINKMLKDLEARQHAPPGTPASHSIYEDLHPAAGEPVPRTVPWGLVLGAAVLVAAGLIAGHFWHAAAGGTIATDLPPRTASAIPATPQRALHTRQIRTSAVIAAGPATGPRDSSGRPETMTPARIRPARAERKPLSDRTAAVRIVLISPGAGLRRPKSASSVSDDSGTTTHGIEKKEIPLTGGQIAENAYRRGVNLLAQGLRTEAELALRSALTGDPRNIKALELLVGLLLEDGHQSGAAELLDQGLAVLPHQSAFIYVLARIDVARGASRSAIALLDKGLPYAGSDPDYLALLATLDQRAGNNADAARMYSRALAIRPLDGSWWIGLGISLEAQKRWAAAREAYDHATLTPLDPALAHYAEQRLDAMRFR